MRITNNNTGSQQTLTLTAGECRALAREALRALAFTKIKRRDGQWETTWKRQVDEKVEPILAVMNALLPKNQPKRKTAA